MCDFGCHWCLSQAEDEDVCNECHECMERIQEDESDQHNLGVYKPKKGDTPEMIYYGELMSGHLDGKNTDFHPMINGFTRLQPKSRIKVIKNLTQLRTMVIVSQTHCFDSVYNRLKTIIPSIYFGELMNIDMLRSLYTTIINTWLVLNTFTPYDVALIFMIHILYLKGCPFVYLVEIDNCYWTSVTNVRQIKAEYNAKMAEIGIPRIPHSFRSASRTAKISFVKSVRAPRRRGIQSIACDGITLKKSNVLSKSTVNLDIDTSLFFDLFPILSQNEYTAWRGDIKKWPAYDSEKIKLHNSLIDHNSVGSLIKFGSTFTGEVENVTVSKINNAFIALYVFIDGNCYHVKISKNYLIVLNCPKMFDSDEENSLYVTNAFERVLNKFNRWAAMIREHDLSGVTFEQFIRMKPSPCPEFSKILASYNYYTCNNLQKVYNALINWGTTQDYKISFLETVNVVYNSSFNMGDAIIAFPLIAENLENSFKTCDCFMCTNCSITIRYQNISRAKDLMATIVTNGTGVVDRKISLKMSSVGSATIFSTASESHISKVTECFKNHIIKSMENTYPAGTPYDDIFRCFTQSAKRINLCVADNSMCEHCNIAHYACKNYDSDILADCSIQLLDKLSCQGQLPEFYTNDNIIMRNRIAEIRS